MTRAAFVVRLLMVVACLVPFTSPRQATASCVANTAVPPLPSPIREEDDSEREEEAGAAKDRARGAQPPLGVAPWPDSFAFPVPPPVSRSAPRSCPSPFDPLRNGLGCPFRC